MYKTQLSVAALSALIAFPAWSASDADIQRLEAQIQALQSEIALLKRQHEVAQEVSQAKAEKQATVSLDRKGLAFTSPDKDLQVKLRGFVQADTRTFFDNSNTSNVDQFLLRAARPSIETRLYDTFATKLMVEFAGDRARVVDAYADYLAHPAFNLRVGKFKAPIGLERGQSETELMLIERNLPTNLVSDRDMGIMFYGDPIAQVLEYQLAFTNGSADLGDSFGDFDDGKEVTARLFAHPFRNSDAVVFRGLGVGIAGSYGEREGTLKDTGVTEGDRTTGRARFFTWRSGAALADTTVADGNAWRLNPQMTFYHGPFGVLGEYVRGVQDVRRGTSVGEIGKEAWSVAASYVLTGEDATFNGVTPRTDFDPKNGGWGAWEVAARYGVLTVDSDAFPTFADITKSAEEAREASLGFTWYLNTNLKLNAAFSHIAFDGGATGGDREAEELLASRVQFRF